MRRWLAILSVLLAVAATAPALGQGTSQMQVPPPGQPLRGPAQPDAAPAAPGGGKGATPAAGVAAPPVSGPPIFMTPLQSPAPRAASATLGTAADQASLQCKATCGRDYYFCLSGASPAECPSTWSQCTTACAAAARRGSTLSPLGSP